MERVIDKIEKGYVLDIVGDIKSSSNPLIMWGTGDIANQIVDYLIQHDVSIDAFWVDGEHENKHRGIDVLSLPEIIEKYSTFDVIVGHSRYDLVNSRCNAINQIDKVFMFNSIAYGFDHPFSYDELSKNSERFDCLYEKLEDELSKKTLIAYLRSIVTCDSKFAIDLSEVFMNYFRNDLFSIGNNESFLDLGAYDGDTLRLFMQECDGKYSNYYAFEPDTKSFAKLTSYVNSEQFENVQCYNMAAWNCKEKLNFGGIEQESCIVAETDNSCLVDADKIDNILENRPISYIKINYYPCALEALLGSEISIKKNMPKIAVTVGFGIEQLLQVAEYITSLNIGYKLYLRYNKPMGNCLVLYAVHE